MSTTILALDPSLCGFAAVVGNAADPEVHEWRTASDGKDPRSRILRYRNLILRVRKKLAEYQPGLCVIEGYSHNSGYRAHYIGEFGGVLRSAIVDHVPLLEVSPRQLKKYATGNGNAPKAAVAAAVARLWGHVINTDNEADALALYHLGRCLVGAEKPKTKAQEDIFLTLHDEAAHLRGLVNGNGH